MYGNQLFDLYFRLNAKEIRDLRKWVRSPFHNKREDVVRLFEYLAKYIGTEKKDYFDYETVFRTVYPDKDYERQAFYYLCSWLKKVTEDYLLYRTAAEDRNITLARIYRQKSLDKHFAEKIKEAEKQTENAPERDADHHLTVFKLYQEKINSAGRESRRDTANLHAANTELTLYYIAQKLKYTCHALSQSLFTKVELEEDFLTEILSYIRRKGYHESVPAVAVYYAYYQAFTGVGDFQTLLALTKKYNGKFPPAEMRDIYLMPINFGIRAYNSGQKHYLREVFEVYRQGLEYGVFLEDNRLSRFTYSNIVSAGLGVKEFTWTENFLHSHKDFLEPKNRENIYKYNLAVFYFQKPDYDRAMQLLVTTEFTDLLYNIQAKRMLLKIYFTLGADDALFSLLDSFKRFLQRQKELGYHRESFLNLIRFTGRLLHLPPGDKAARVKLAEEIEGTKEVADKGWLLGCTRGLQ